jgi:hypothetical protein
MKLARNIFITLFLFFITIPLILLDSKSSIAVMENRTMAVLPDKLSDRFFTQIDDYINDRFGFREYFIKFYHSVMSRSTKGIKNGAIFGKEDWLFYLGNNNLADFQKRNLFDEETLQRFILQLEKRSAWCEENGIKFLFVITPNKHSVYPEYYPFERPEGITRSDQIMDALPDTLKDKVLFPRDYIVSKKSAYSVPLYIATDTHWNGLGAFHCFELILQKMQAYFPQTVFPEFNWETHIDKTVGKGDIVAMAGLRHYGTDTHATILPEGGWDLYYTFTKYEVEPSRKVNMITNHNRQDLPKAMIFFDSFFGAIQPFTSGIFSNTNYRWKILEDRDKEYILENKPDILIWEILERLIPQDVSEFDWK